MTSSAARAGGAGDPDPPIPAGFSGRVVRWQARCGRSGLPWQAAPSPYKTWVSEVMLQQTRASTVAPYFERFVARFPDARSLAAADLDEVLALWSGLGYYARARNLHGCARELAADRSGELPRTAAELVRLPGIGESTAGAILSLGFGEPAAVLDANVARVLARVFLVEEPVGSGAGRARLWSLARRLLPGRRDAAAYSQGMMDLGALVCLPKEPRCAKCPLRSLCAARREGAAERLPVKSRLPAKKELSLSLAVILHEGHVLLSRRPLDSFWGGLWVPPAFGSDRERRRFAARFGRAGRPRGAAGQLAAFETAFTHLRIRFAPRLTRARERMGADGAAWFRLDRLKEVGMPPAVRKLLEPLARDARRAAGDGHAG